jgi:type VI secretion system protein ImpH
MAPHSGRNNARLEDILYQDASAFEFHAAVKILEALQTNEEFLGEVKDISKESLRFKSHATFRMQSTDIQTLLKPVDENSVPALVLNFFGIATRQGPLPEPYMELLIRRIESKDTAFRDFLDLFNHRLTSLLHRIRKKYWIGISTQAPEKTLMGKCLYSLLGLDGKYLQQRLSIPDRSLFYYAGLLWQKPRSLVGLKKLLKSFFKFPLDVHQLQGQWITVRFQERSKLGTSFSTLGQEAILGSKFWDQQSFFKIEIGPLSLEEFIGFLKPGHSYKQLIHLTRYYVGTDHDFKINLILHKEEVPKVRLGRGAALGWTAWLTKKTFIQDDAQVMLSSSPNFLPTCLKIVS